MKPLVIYHASCADGFAAAFAAWLKLGDEAEYVPMQYRKIDFDFDGGFFNLGSHEAANPCTFIAGRDVYILDFSFPRPIMDAIFRNAKRVVWLDHHKSAFEMWCGGIPEDGVYMCSIGSIDQGHFIRLHNEKSGAILAWEYFHPRVIITNHQQARPWAIRFNGYGDDAAATAGFMEDEMLYSREAAEREATRMNASALSDGRTPAINQERIYEARLAPEGYGEEYSEVPMFIRHIDDHDRWQFKIEGTKEFQKALWSYAPSFKGTYHGI